MRLKPEYRVRREQVSRTPMIMGDRRTLGGKERKEMDGRIRDLAGTAQRLYSSAPTHTSPWWTNFCEGYPARVASQSGHWNGGIKVFESGEIELRDICGGSPSSCRVRKQLARMTEGLEITTWGERPVLWTEDGTKLTRNDYRPLRRYVTPHQIDRDLSNACPTVLVDHDLSIATPLAYGENGMTVYWPDERSYPITWASWLVTIENEKTNKVMASALRLVCKYANAMNSVAHSKELTNDEQIAYRKEGERVAVEWKTPAPMMRYLALTDNPHEIAQKIVDDHSSRQLIALAAMMTVKNASPLHARYVAANGYQGRLQFSKSSTAFRMLREQLSNQYETKYLYTKPPEYRSNWQLVSPPMD